jgi:hypothetical protein
MASSAVICCAPKFVAASSGTSRERKKRAHLRLSTTRGPISTTILGHGLKVLRSCGKDKPHAFFQRKDAKGQRTQSFFLGGFAPLRLGAPIGGGLPRVQRLSLENGLAARPPMKLAHSISVVVMFAQHRGFREGDEGDKWRGRVLLPDRNWLFGPRIVHRQKEANARTGSAGM